MQSTSKGEGDDSSENESMRETKWNAFVKTTSNLPRLALPLREANSEIPWKLPDNLLP